MTPDQLVRDPLYQINLVLWMLTPSSGTSIEPVLYRAGFTVHQIEAELRLPLRLSSALQEVGIVASSNISPDLLLKGQEKEYLIVECKAAMFGDGDDRAQRQARALLLQEPIVLCDGLSLQPGAVAKTHLLYLTAHDSNHDQLAGLAKLDDELRKAKFSTTKHGLLKLRVKGNRVVIDSSGLPLALQRVASDGVLAVHELADEDPRPLYRIAWMPGSESDRDEYNQQQFAKRILAAAAMQIARTKVGKKQGKAVHLPIEPILNEITSGFFAKWKKRDEKRVVQEKAIEILRIQISKFRQALRISDGSGVAFYLPDRTVQTEVVEGLNRWNNAEYPTDIQTPLFPQG